MEKWQHRARKLRKRRALGMVVGNRSIFLLNDIIIKKSEAEKAKKEKRMKSGPDA